MVTDGYKHRNMHLRKRQKGHVSHENMRVYVSECRILNLFRGRPVLEPKYGIFRWVSRCAIKHQKII